ncbi:MAG: hypothetical protein WBA97_22380 [Actinophytocola sp.]|uniref:hypothetical protein n=1 Tax=Actinophytocola sp. TaxID=1872138 RepID=UPI003C71D87A
MSTVRGELTTDMVDLTELSLAEVRSSTDPVLLQSIDVLVGRMECSRTGVLQNQVPDEF